jgi:hypothetical protein
MIFVSRKILILCNDFPPINSIGAERPYSWYKYFKEFGFEPIVITKNWITDGSTPFNDVSYHRLEEITELGTIIRSAKKNTLSIRFRSIFGQRFHYLRKALTLLEKLLSFSNSSFDQHRAIYFEAKAYLKKHEVHTIITTGEPFLLFKYGYLLKKKFKVHWIADYRDGWYLNHVRSIQTDFFNKIIRSWELKFELKYTSNADLLTTVDPELAQRIEKLTKKKTQVIYNGFWDYYDSVQIMDSKPNIVINHTGTLTYGQQIEFLLDALVELKLEKKIDENYLQLNLIGLEYFQEQMNRILPYQKILGKMLNTTPRLLKSEATKLNLTADYLVNFTDHNVTGIYAKTFEYIACRKTILVIPSDRKLLEDLIVKNNLGYSFDSKEDLKQFLLNPKKNKFEPRNLEFFTRKVQAKIFSEVVSNNYS